MPDADPADAARAESAGALAVLAVIAVSILGAAAVYEVAAALKLLSVGPEPGDEAPGEYAVYVLALLAILGGCGASFVNASRRNVQVGTRWMLLAPAAIAFVAARFYSFDPYYAPTLRRYSEGGSVSGWWVLALAVAALVAAALTRLRPSLGMTVTGFVLVVGAITAVAEGVGH